MEITKVPFVEHTGIRYDATGNLEFSTHKLIENHLETIHASAQFALAETASGEHLQELFPELADQVIPLLRDATNKYRKPASISISAHVSVPGDAFATFQKQFQKKGRGSIEVAVELIDPDGSVTCSGLFKWFVQRIETSLDDLTC